MTYKTSKIAFTCRISNTADSTDETMICSQSIFSWFTIAYTRAVEQVRYQLIFFKTGQILTRSTLFSKDNFAINPIVKCWSRDTIGLRSFSDTYSSCTASKALVIEQSVHDLYDVGCLNRSGFQCAIWLWTYSLVPFFLE